MKPKQFKYKGESMSLGEWAKKLGIPYNNLYMRLQNGWTFARAVEEPVKPHSGRKKSKSKARRGRKPNDAMPVHMLLHYAKFLSEWTQSFARLVGIVRGGMWLEIDLVETLILYGTAGPREKPTLCLEQACFKGFEDLVAKPMGQKRRARLKK